MIPLLLAILAIQPPPVQRVTVTSGRDMAGLQNPETVIRGTCDGQPASATITRTADGRNGRIVLRVRRLTRQFPRSFLNGAVIINTVHSLGLACDGRRLQLHGTAIRPNPAGEIRLETQDIVLDIRTGALSIGSLMTLSPAETRAEFTN